MFFSSRPARQLALAAGLLGFATLTACNKGGASGDFAKTKSGVEYKIFKGEGGKYTFKEVANGADPTYKDRLGKVLAVHMEYRTSGDSVLMKSRERQFGMPVRVPLDTLKARGMGAEQEAFSLLQPGDSGVFRFNADSLYMRNAHQLAPANLKKKGNYITLLVKADKLQSRDEAMAAAQADQQKMMAEQQRKMMSYAAEQLKKDDVVLQDYIKKNNLTVKKTPSGMYYQVLKPGVGSNAKSGQKVSVNYTGSLLSGKVFDSSDKAGKPFEFPLGQGQVIPGWDEGIALLNKGSRAILLIPSTLAYGQRGAGADIPADSPLRFEVELVDVK
jgi:FKBP-type peptidyl-prolyl cis-trans isomerase